MQSCRTCNFDLCQQCYGRLLKENITKRKQERKDKARLLSHSAALAFSTDTECDLCNELLNETSDRSYAELPCCREACTFVACVACVEMYLIKNGGMPLAQCPVCCRAIQYVKMSSGKCGPLGDKHLQKAGTWTGTANTYVSLFAGPEELVDGVGVGGVPKTKLRVVIDGANVLFHSGPRERDWDCLENAASRFLDIGVCPVIVLKETHFCAIPPAMAITRAHCVVAPRARDGRFPGGGGEEDDMVCASLSLHYHCPLLSNDSFHSWLTSHEWASSELSAVSVWISRLEVWGAHLTFVVIEGELVTMPPYPTAKAASVQLAMSQAPPLARAPGSAVVTITARFLDTVNVETSSDELASLKLSCGDTVKALEEAIFGKLEPLPPGSSVFLFTDDGHPLKGNASLIEDAFAGSDTHCVFISSGCVEEEALTGTSPTTLRLGAFPSR